MSIRETIMNQIEDVKEKLTSDEYKKIMESIQEIKQDSKERLHVTIFYPWLSLNSDECERDPEEPIQLSCDVKIHNFIIYKDKVDENTWKWLKGAYDLPRNKNNVQIDLSHLYMHLHEDICLDFLIQEDMLPNDVCSYQMKIGKIQMILQHAST